MPEIRPEKLTPMLAQYLSIKRQYPDAFLFYRMGDFYELFFEDAVAAAPIMEVQLTTRDRSAESPIPMCGVPHHSVTGYLQKLLSKGHKVALCEQVEDPATAKGIVKREVVRILTPALIADPEMISEERANNLLAIKANKNDFDLAVLDLLGGSLSSASGVPFDRLGEVFYQFHPEEILTDDSIDADWLAISKEYAPSAVLTVRKEYFSQTKDEKSSPIVEAVKSYLVETQKLDQFPHFDRVGDLFEKQGMSLDPTTLSSLEILRSPNEGPTLFSTLDRTTTPMGRRLLKSWLFKPSTDRKQILRRLDAVSNFYDDPRLIDDFSLELNGIRDLERLSVKTSLGLGTPRDLVTIREILHRLPKLRKLLLSTKASLLKELGNSISEEKNLAKLLTEALEDNPPLGIREGGIIRGQFDPEVNELRTISTDAKGHIASMEEREKKRTGIHSLKIKFSRVFGYTIEITNTHLSKVPAGYHRKQTIANGERFVTDELKRFEERSLVAEQKLKTLEESLFIDIRKKVSKRTPILLQTANALATADVLLSFAKISRERNYHRPTFHSALDLKITDGRHPVVESILPNGSFVPNSIEFIDDEVQTWLITGPNMAGKSTIMRQTALISWMGQMGCFVPAKSAKLPVLDAIFTRIGASDDLARGRSTFMVEMSEVARILDRATAKSLILIDEIGRGTSTYDGLSLAWSILEYVHHEVRAKTLFATHFHELTTLEKSLPGLRNANVLVDKWQNEIVFLYRMGPGVCTQSYGIEVAKLAGLPPKTLSRAREILGVLETQSQCGSAKRNRVLNNQNAQLAFFEEPKISETRPESGSQTN